MLSYNLLEVLNDKEIYETNVDILTNQLLTQYGYRKELVNVEVNDESFIMTKANLLTQLILMRPFNDFGTEGFNSDFILFKNENDIIDNNVLDKVFNNIILHFQDKHDYLDINESISWSIKILSDISGEANVKSGNSISLYSLIKASDEEPELKDLFNFSIQDNLQFDEIENLLNQKSKEMVNILSNTDNVLKNYLLSKTGINVKQMRQCILNVGLKPDLNGNVISEPINTNYLNGLRNSQDLFINAIGSRKALITNYKQVKDSGYLTRKLSLLTVDTTLDLDTKDCNTKHYINMNVTNEKTLERIVGRFYVDPLTNEQHEIKHDSTELIGKDLQLRSPITCGSKKGICRRCYGDKLAELNKDLHVGILGTLFLTNIITQMLLSTKHLLQTKSTKMEWSEDFLEYFVVDKNMIMLNEIHGNSVNSIVIDKDDIEEDEETKNLSVNRIFIKGKTKTTEINLPISLFITEELSNNLGKIVNDNERIGARFKSIDTNIPVFNLVMANNELSASLRNILDLIETNRYIDGNTIHNVYNRFIELLNESEISIASVHIENILRNMIRSYSNQLVRPDFTKEELEPYTIMRVADALLHNENLAISVSFEKIKAQLENPETYIKEGKSLFDEVF